MRLRSFTGAYRSVLPKDGIPGSVAFIGGDPPVAITYGTASPAAGSRNNPRLFADVTGFRRHLRNGKLQQATTYNINFYTPGAISVLPPGSVLSFDDTEQTSIDLEQDGVGNSIINAGSLARNVPIPAYLSDDVLEDARKIIFESIESANVELQVNNKRRDELLTLIDGVKSDISNLQTLEQTLEVAAARVGKHSAALTKITSDLAAKRALVQSYEEEYRSVTQKIVELKDELTSLSAIGV